MEKQWRESLKGYKNLEITLFKMVAVQCSISKLDRKARACENP